MKLVSVDQFETYTQPDDVIVIHYGALDMYVENWTTYDDASRAYIIGEVDGLIDTLRANGFTVEADNVQRDCRDKLD